MPSESRRVTVAPGHVVLVRRLRAPADRAGYIRVQTKPSRRKPARTFEVPEAAWQAGGSA